VAIAAGLRGRGPRLPDLVGEAGEEADQLRDPTHVRNYSEDEWRGMFGEAGLELEAYELEGKRIDFEAWLDRSGTPDEDRPRIRELVADRVEGGKLRLERAIFKARKN